MRLQFLIFLLIFSSTETRDLFVKKACESEPNLIYCRPSFRAKFEFSTPSPASDQNQNIFENWAKIVARDSKDIEDLEIDETGKRGKPENIDEYCSKYVANYKSYCSPGKLEILEGLLAQFCTIFQKNCGVSGNGDVDFPTPKPFFGAGNEKKSMVVDSMVEKMVENENDDFCTSKKSQFESECSPKTALKNQEFCGNYQKICGRIEKVDEKTDDDSLEDLDLDLEENAEHKKEEPEGQGAKNDDEVQKYCTNYVENYNFFCAGEKVPEHEKFCESYKKNCPDSAPFKESGSFLGTENSPETSDSTSSDSTKSTYLYKGTKREYCQKFSVNYEYYCKGTIENAEIYVKFCPSYRKACPNEANPDTIPQKPKKSDDDEEEFPDFDNPGKGKSRKSGGKKERKKVSCKCDYAYPAVQKFCNPPPLPLFLNTCRLWYHGCPKYEQYHYASQFVYSKAEKGKVLEGPKLQTTFQLLTPNGQALPYKPTRIKREENIEENVVFWPMSKENHEEIEDEKMVLWENSRNSTSKIELVKPPEIPQRKKDTVALEKPPEIPANLISRKKDDVELEKAPNLPRTKKTTGGQSVPVFSDSVFSNAVSQYNTLTDSRGILHRPRSRSPFTKPGLWEPNPDDPHNRDHANKYYYAPRSVNVDWLQGQLAWGAHWAVPAAGVGGTDGFSALHFPSIGTFLNIPDDYD
ncbi:unnamed protein product [Caenorhabditis angaria]|uniref:Uncharacterized protein n=1 Tax=Caenorhabditis angaria TaxID=860376 RepID=A0A9P1N2M2_9PELO|nr:unnamed protein product [Caenorhabditis angaria]